MPSGQEYLTSDVVDFLSASGQEAYVNIPLSVMFLPLNSLISHALASLLFLLELCSPNVLRLR